MTDTMNIDVLLSDDETARKAALAEYSALPASQRDEIHEQLATKASELADELVSLDEEGEDTDEVEARLRAALEALGTVSTTDDSLDALAAHDGAVVRKLVADALSFSPSAHRQRLLEQLISDEDDDVLKEAAEAVARGPWAGAAAPLLAATDRHAVPPQAVTTALAAAAALSDRDMQARVSAKLLAVARSASSQKRPFDAMQCHTALDALVRFGTTFPGVQEAAAELATSDDLRTRVAGIALLAGGGDESTFVRLLELAARGSTDESAHANVHLRALPPTVVAAALVRNMASDDPLVRARSAELSVGTIFLAREATVEPLLALTKDPDGRVRAAAVASLGRALPPGKAFFGDKKDEIAPALDALASDPSKEVQEALQRARKVLGLG